MLVGQTGAGKSYLANALLGELDPSNGPFTTGDNIPESTHSDDEYESVTVNVHGKTADFFGEAHKRDFGNGIDHFSLNIVDTPGWGDSDPVKRAKNSQRIAQVGLKLMNKYQAN